MKNKEGAKFISDKMMELELLGKSYTDAIEKKYDEIKKLEKEISNYKTMRTELYEKYNSYASVLADLEPIQPKPVKNILSPNGTGSVSVSVSDNVISTVTNMNHPLNKNVTPTSSKNTVRQVGIVGENSDEFIEYIRKITILTKFEPSVKNTIVEQSNNEVAYIKISSSLDLKSRDFDSYIILPFAHKNPEYKRIMVDILPLIRVKKF